MSAHLFNSQDRHEACQVYGDPSVRTVDDGHVHWHHLDPAPEGHLHGEAWHPAEHVHADTFHDPCDQAGMLQVAMPDAPPFDAPPLPEVVIGVPVPGTVDVILRNVLEGVRLPVPILTLQDQLIVRSDADLARFPGKGTPADPYRIEGYHVRDLLMVKDTSKCVVIANNVVYNDALRGPVVDPSLVKDLEKVVAQRQALVDARAATLADARGALAAAEERLATLQAELPGREAEIAALEASLQDLDAQAARDEAAHRAALADALATMDDVLEETRILRDALEAQAVAVPEEPTEPEPGDAAFGAFATQVQEAAESPPSPDELIATHVARLADLRALLDERSARLDAAQAARDATLAARDAVAASLGAAQADLAAWLVDALAPADAAAVDARASVAEAEDALAAAGASLADAQAQLADHAFEHLGVPYGTLDELARDVVSKLPPPPQLRAGRLVLDWNGQCVHAYHNVVQDLRVNRNNVRTGFATGGLIEDNRIFTVGQIRHFDGELRTNEIGDRRYVEAYLNGSLQSYRLDAGADVPANGGPETPILRAGRVINADGFNEAWMHDNLIYGAVDLDLHGHHHGPGFFARESHYHGSTRNAAYMVNASTGACQYAQPQVPGRLAPLGIDQRVPVLDSDAVACLPHHDHAKRWTSVRFEDNVILDPAGYGLRYEDQNHAGDDRVAASEAMAELNRPHFHQTHVAIADNVVVGNVWIDVFNADGIDLWSDDHSPVQRDAAGIVLDVVSHPLARIVSSHPLRNDGWLDVTGNTVLVVDKDRAVRSDQHAWSAIQVAHAKQIDRADVSGNHAYLVGRWFKPGTTDPAVFAAKLRDLAGWEPGAAYEEVRSWGGQRSTQTSYGLLLRGVADSLFRVCGNAMLGFARGIEATQAIRPDVAFQDCGDNDWGAASPTFRLVTTPYPEPREALLDQVADATEDTPLDAPAHSLADHAKLVVNP